MNGFILCQQDKLLQFAEREGERKREREHF